MGGFYEVLMHLEVHENQRFSFCYICILAICYLIKVPTSKLRWPCMCLKENCE
jgi:hypothetical protein